MRSTRVSKGLNVLLADRAFKDISVKGLTVWLDGHGSAPSEKLLRVDYNSDGESILGLPEALLALGLLAPSFIVPGYVVRVHHDLDNSSVALRLEPSDSASV